MPSVLPTSSPPTQPSSPWWYTTVSLLKCRVEWRPEGMSQGLGALVALSENLGSVLTPA